MVERLTINDIRQHQREGFQFHPSSYSARLEDTAIAALAEVESLRTQLASAREQFQAIRDTKTWAYSAANTGHDFPVRCSFALSDMDGIAKHALCGATDCGCAEEFCCENTPKNRLVDDLAAVRTDLSEARRALEDIAREDYRGPRPSGAVKAAAALVLLDQSESAGAGGPLPEA